MSLVFAAPAHYDESIAETVGSNDISNIKEDLQYFILRRIATIPVFLIG